MLTTQIPNRIREVRQSRGVTLEELEERTGISNGQLSRIETGKRGVSFEKLELIARGLDVDPTALIIDVDSFEAVEVRGTIQGGLWVEQMWWGSGQRYTIAVPRDHRFRVGDRFGLEVKGTASNLRYPEGTVVICVSVASTFRPEEPGSRYVIQRWQDKLVETTVRKFTLDERGGKWLIAETNDPQFQTPLAWEEERTEEITIIARVTGSYMPE